MDNTFLKLGQNEIPVHDLNCPLAIIKEKCWNKGVWPELEFVVGQFVKFIGYDYANGIAKVALLGDEHNERIYELGIGYVVKIDTPKKATLVELLVPSDVKEGNPYVVVNKESGAKTIYKTMTGQCGNYLDGDRVDDRYFNDNRVYAILLPEDM